MAVTFPQAPLDARVSIALAQVGAWTDITSCVYQREGTSAPISIKRGRPGEGSQISPSSMAMQVNNRDGRFSPRYPLGAWYGQLGANTPVRVSVPGQTVRLRAEDDYQSGLSCPGGSGLAVTGDLDIRSDIRLSGWAAPSDAAAVYDGYWASVIAAQWQLAGNQRCWFLAVQQDGTLMLGASKDGTDSTLWSAASTMPVPQGRTAVRVTVAMASGTLTFWTAAAGDADTGPWAQLGETVTASSISVFASSAAPLAIGYSADIAADTTGLAAMTGDVYELEVRQGIGGTVAAHPVITAQPAGTTSFADAQGNTWTLGGTATIDNRSYRFHGEMSSAPKAQDSTGTDLWVPYACGGILRRIQQGDAPLYSPLRRATTSFTANPVVGYWPMEDSQGATAFGSAIGGGLMQITGSPQLADDSSFACSSPLPVFGPGASAYAVIPAYTGGGSIQVRFLMNAQTAPANGARIMRVITTGTCAEFSCYYGTGGQLGLTGIAAGGAVVFDTGGINFGILNQPVWVQMLLQPGSGGTVDFSLTTLIPGQATGNVWTGSAGAGTVGNATAVAPAPTAALDGVTIGHVSVQAAPDSIYDLYQPLNAWDGEPAGSRFGRLCAENGIPARVFGAPAVSAAMGAQPAGTLPELLQQCEDADLGMMFEPRGCYALGYRTLASLLNQAFAVTVDWSSGQLGWKGWQPPVGDDQNLLNDWTLTRDTGSSGNQTSGATYTFQLDDGSPRSISPPPAGAGDYADQDDVNVQADGQLPDMTGWLVHRGTVDEDRFPAIAVDLTRSQCSSIFYEVLDAEIGDCIGLSTPPQATSVNTIRQLAAGVTESLGGFFLQLEWNCVPESPYETGILDDPVYGRADTDGAALYTSVDASATQLLVASAGGLATGAYLNYAGMGYSGIAAAMAAWGSWTGVPLAAVRDYSNGLSDFTLHSRYTQETAGGAKLCLDLKPAFSPVSAGDLASLQALLAGLQALGVTCEISLWHEPYYNGLTAAQYIAMIQYYGPAVRQYYPLVFCTSLSAVANNGENSYYPGDAWVDKIATDFYAVNYVNGYSLDLAASIANNARPPKPFALWEFGDLLSGGNYLTQPNSGFEPNSAGTWTTAGNCAIAPSSAQAHSGSYSLALTASAAGNMSAASSTAAAITANGMPCSPGDSIAAAAFFRAAATARSVQMGVTFYNAAGASLGTLSGSTVADSATGWTQGSCTVTAPANSAWCRAQPTVVSAASGEVHYVDDVSLADLADGYSAAQVSAYLAYIQQYFASRAQGGLPNADILRFNSPGVNSTMIQSASDGRLAGITAIGETEVLPLWTTAAADFPFDVQCGGERMTVTGVSGTASPQVLTVTRGVNGLIKAQAAGTPLSLFYPPVQAIA
jgi:hypothetical protein